MDRLVGDRRVVFGLEMGAGAGLALRFGRAAGLLFDEDFLAAAFAAAVGDRGRLRDGENQQQDRDAPFHAGITRRIPPIFKSNHREIDDGLGDERIHLEYFALGLHSDR